MTDTIDAIVTRIHALELELEAEFAKQRAGLRYGLEHGKVLFEEDLLRRHRELQTGLARYLLKGPRGRRRTGTAAKLSAATARKAVPAEMLWMR